MDAKPLISVVVPVYRAEGCIEELYRRLVLAIEPISSNFEMILVEDCGPDASWKKIVQLAAIDTRVKGVKLARNYGQHFAITAGLDHVSGDWIVVMDCDLQDPPEEIPRLYAKALEGFDIVMARRQDRKNSWFRTQVSRVFVWLYNVLGDIKADNQVANFSISSRNVIDNVRRFKERNRSFPLFLNEVGFRRAIVDVTHAPRFAGESSYNLFKLLDLATQCIVFSSNKPLKFSIQFGFFLSAMSLATAAYFVFNYFYRNVTITGWTSLMVTLTFLCGLLFANLGILGLYLGKVFDEVKGRPLYVVERSLNLAPTVESSLNLSHSSTAGGKE